MFTVDLNTLYVLVQLQMIVIEGPIFYFSLITIKLTLMYQISREVT